MFRCFRPETYKLKFWPCAFRVRGKVRALENWKNLKFPKSSIAKSCIAGWRSYYWYRVLACFVGIFSALVRAIPKVNQKCSHSSQQFKQIRITGDRKINATNNRNPMSTFYINLGTSEHKHEMKMLLLLVF